MWLVVSVFRPRLTMLGGVAWGLAYHRCCTLDKAFLQHVCPGGGVQAGMVLRRCRELSGADCHTWRPCGRMQVPHARLSVGPHYLQCADHLLGRSCAAPGRGPACRMGLTSQRPTSNQQLDATPSAAVGAPSMCSPVQQCLCIVPLSGCAPACQGQQTLAAVCAGLDVTWCAATGSLQALCALLGSKRGMAELLVGLWSCPYHPVVSLQCLMVLQTQHGGFIHQDQATGHTGLGTAVPGPWYGRVLLAFGSAAVAMSGLHGKWRGVLHMLRVR